MYSKGDRVAILNTTIMGRVILEGWGHVVTVPEGRNEFFGVTFGDDPQVFHRRVNDTAQADPEAYVKRLNERLVRNP